MSVFKFKQFDVKQADAAMKVGTDSVLLGSLLEANNPLNILDIGAGTGLLALMMAQRFFDANIEAVELEKTAFDEAQFNVNQSKWKKNISVFNQSFQTFCVTDKQYDLMVSNPPYYEVENHFSIRSKQRSKARHTETLSFDDLIEGIQKLLSETGLCWMVLPTKEFTMISEKAQLKGLFVVTQIFIHPRVGRDYNRVVFCLRKQSDKLQQSDFFICDVDGIYTEQYKAITMPFLLWKEQS